MNSKADKFYQEYLDREVDMAEVFDKQLRLVQELQNRIEHEMFKGMQYKANERGSGVSLYDPKLTKSAESLGKLVVQLQGSHLRILKEGERARKKMSLDDKVDATIKFIRSLPKGYLLKITDALKEGSK